MMIKNVFLDKESNSLRVDRISSISGKDRLVQYHTKYFYEGEWPQDVKDWLSNGKIRKTVQENPVRKTIIADYYFDENGNLRYVEN